MNCHRVTNLLSAYVDGELTGVEMLSIRRHLSDCGECAEEYEAVRFTKMAVVRLATVQPRESFAALILKNLDHVYVSPQQRLINAILGSVHEKLSPVAAALAASGLALVLLTSGGTWQPEVNNVVASAPYESSIHDLTLPGSPVSIPISKSVKVAQSSSDVHGITYEMAVLTH